MLSSPLMMNHVRSYYQNQNNQSQKPKFENKIEKNLLKKNNTQTFKLKNKYICRTRKGWTKKQIKNKNFNCKTIKKRNFEGFNKNQKNLTEIELVLTKRNEDKMSLGKFSLKRVSQI